LGQAAEVGVGEEAPVPGPPHAVAGTGEHDDEEAQRVGAAAGVPWFGDDDDPEEAEADGGEGGGPEPLRGQQHQRGEDRADRGGRVADARERRRHPGFADDEPGEGQHGQPQAAEGEVRPDSPVAGQPGPGEAREQGEDHGATEDPEGRDLDRVERGEPDLHEEETAPPDEREQDELDLPGQAGRVRHRS